jgi:hypothetical protein
MKLFSQEMLGMLGAKDETRKRYFTNETATVKSALNRTPDNTQAGERGPVHSPTLLSAELLVIAHAGTALSIITPQFEKATLWTSRGGH